MYDAFISYSHARDRKIASAVQSVIQTLAKPWWTVRAARVFRDDTSLSAAPGLSSALDKALASSRYLVLFASPQSAGSKWCGHEVKTWLDTKGSETLLIALTEGELCWDNQAIDFVWGPETPLPPVMRGRLRAEPLWVDLRAFRDGGEKVSRNNQVFLAAGAALAAPIRGIAREDLLSEEVANQRRNLLWVRAAAATLALLAGLAAWQAVEATLSRDLARSQRDRAQRVLDQISASANARVASMAERARQAARTRQEIVDAAARGALRPKSFGDPMSVMAQVDELLDLGLRYLAREDAAAALKASEAAQAKLRATNATQNGSPETRLARARSHELAGVALARLGRPEDASRELALGLELIGGLAENAPDNVLLQARWSTALQSMGDIDVKLQRWDDAEQRYGKALALRAKAAQGDDASIEARQSLAASHNRIANLELERSRHGAALAANSR